MFDFTRNGPDWQSYRSAAQQSVKPTIIKNYIEPQAQCADDLVTWLEKYGNNNPEVKFAFMCYSADGNASDVQLFNLQHDLISTYVTRCGI